MRDYDSSPMLHCSGVFSHKIRFASKGLGNSRMFAHDSPAAFLSMYKEKQQQQKKKRGCDSSPLLLFARGVTVSSNFS